MQVKVNICQFKIDQLLFLFLDFSSRNRGSKPPKSNAPPEMKPVIHQLTLSPLYRRDLRESERV